MISAHKAQLNKVAAKRLGRAGLAGFSLVWVAIGYLAVSRALDTGNWLIYLLAFVSAWQVIRFARLSIKYHDNN